VAERRKFARGVYRIGDHRMLRGRGIYDVWNLYNAFRRPGPTGEVSMGDH